MGLRDTVKQRAALLATDPRVVRVLQSPRLANALISLVKGVGRLQAGGREQLATMAHRFGWAPRHELKELERRLQRAEEENSRLARRLADVEKP